MRADKSKMESNTSKKKKKFLTRGHVVSIGLAIYDVLMSALAYLTVLWIRYDCTASKIPAVQMEAWYKFIGINAVLVLVVFTIFKLYSSIWKYASYVEAVRVSFASVIVSIIHSLMISFIFARMPITYYLGGALLQLIFVVGIRFSYRFGRLITSKNRSDLKGTSNVMIIGAGSAGQMIIRDIHTAKELNDRAACVIDDDPNYWGRTIEGVKVVGGRNDILSAVEKYNIQKIYFAIPTATAEQKRDILNVCKETGCEMKILPGMYELINGNVHVSNLQKVDIVDLLGREPIKVDMAEIFRNLVDKVVLVTGGGGSIGSELCRQIASHKPKQLIIFDIYENNAHAIQLELRDKFPELNLVVLIGSVRDVKKVNWLFKTYRPDYVYHAAAHKHVPLMEDSPTESIKNNAIGTYKCAYAAVHYGCKKFVLISTDKAVNPTNIMGASKRLCEMVIQTFAEKVKEGKVEELPEITSHMNCGADVLPMPEEKPTTQFVAVRFGNVLGSNGSVIPRFKEQIEKGGPVTVTHPDIIRYFMTIPEAVSLVLSAGNYANGGEIFVLDMGTPVKIDTLARNLIKLSGLEPDVDIKVEYTGLRPGEKLFEEKLMAEEGMRKTPNDLIHIGNPLEFDYSQFVNQLIDLMEAAYDNREDIRELVEKVVTTYHPAPNSENPDRLKPVQH